MDNKMYVAHSHSPIYIDPKMVNRHGLIAGATGTGKTVSLQVLAETFSRAGIPSFLADMKGDLAGLSQAGVVNKFIEARIQEFGMDRSALNFSGAPVRFFDVFGEQGHPMRTTISEMGPLLLSRLLDLNDTQEGVLNIVFRIADEKQLLLIDIKDLRAMLDWTSKNSKEYTSVYGNVSASSIGAIQRALLALESQGADKFFGEPAFNIFDLLQSEGGRGVLNILAADKLMMAPKLYSTFLLWLLSELYDQLPEVGDLPVPKFVFFFDEAHMLFEDAPKALKERVELVVRLIRSKGVGVYFISQSPADIPIEILGQLGNRIQHALRAFTPQDQKVVRAAAQTFRTNPKFNTEQAILELGTGEALVSFLDDKGSPSVVERAKMLFPLSQIGAIRGEQREALIKQSRLFGMYERQFDRDSAYERISIEQMEEQRMAAERERREMEYQREKKVAPSGTQRRAGSKSALDKAIGSAATSIGRSVGTQIVRGILGAIFKR
ncbi:MAG: ATP-binding protein [Bacteroidetes bacterium 41-46]|nr:MAG: ATP-binding protein [Bacteroidetes bacterium 41-46]